MNYKTIIALAFAVSVPALAPAFQGSNRAGEPGIDEVIRKFAAAETENQIARNNYTFTQDFDLVTLGEAGSVTGRYKRVSDIVYDDRGARFEKITLFPPPTAMVSITKEDLQDLAGVQPFALTTEALPRYVVTFTGKEKVDELNTYVFDVKPKQLIKGERYLEGRIWVDDEDFQIVKVAGKAVPEIDDQKFPRFESYRENIDGRYWFPTYIHADDVLEFRKGPAIRLRMTVRFTNYKKFGGRIRVLDDAEPASEGDVKAAEKERPPAAPAKPPVKPPVKPPTR
jgi:hypothetical protein